MAVNSTELCYCISSAVGLQVGLCGQCRLPSEVSRGKLWSALYSCFNSKYVLMTSNEGILWRRLLNGGPRHTNGPLSDCWLSLCLSHGPYCPTAKRYVLELWPLADLEFFRGVSLGTRASIEGSGFTWEWKLRVCRQDLARGGAQI